MKVCRDGLNLAIINGRAVTEKARRFRSAFLQCRPQPHFISLFRPELRPCLCRLIRIALTFYTSTSDRKATGVGYRSSHQENGSLFRALLLKSRFSFKRFHFRCSKFECRFEKAYQSPAVSHYSFSV